MCGGFRFDQGYLAAAQLKGDGKFFSTPSPAPASSGGESAALDLEADHGELAVLEAQACAGRDGEVEERFGAVMNVTIVL